MRGERIPEIHKPASRHEDEHVGDTQMHECMRDVVSPREARCGIVSPPRHISELFGQVLERKQDIIAFMARRWEHKVLLEMQICPQHQESVPTEASHHFYCSFQSPQSALNH